MPDLVFLDVELEDGTGFDILKALNPIKFKVIFITGHQDFAIQAFKYSAIDYLIKPIDSIDLKDAVRKAQEKIKQEDLSLKYDALIQNIEPNNQLKKIILKTSDSIYSVLIKDIIRCEADKNYTTFYLTNTKKIIISNTLKEYDKLLSPYGFFRVQQSHLINMAFFSHYLKKDGGMVVLNNSDQIPVSSAKRDELMKYIEQH